MNKYIYYPIYHNISNIKENTIYILYVNNNLYNLLVENSKKIKIYIMKYMNFYWIKLIN